LFAAQRVPVGLVVPAWTFSLTFLLYWYQSTSQWQFRDDYSPLNWRTHLKRGEPLLSLRRAKLRVHRTNQLALRSSIPALILDEFPPSDDCHAGRRSHPQQIRRSTNPQIATNIDHFFGGKKGAASGTTQQSALLPAAILELRPRYCVTGS
jgi:hypothetical protein